MNALQRKLLLRKPVVLTVMVGNTRTTAVRWSPSGTLMDRGAWPTNSGGKALARKIAAARCDGIAAIVLAGVVPAIVAELARTLESSIVNRQSSILLRFRRNLPCTLLIRPRPAKRVGDDRLAAALGALAIDPRAPWVIVDAGTALTVNSVRPAMRRTGAALGIFEGGLIVPGEQLALSALGGGTAQLPALSPLATGAKAPVCGRSTVEAIRFGVRRAQIATVCTLARAQAEALGLGARVVLTGGGAKALWPCLRTELRSYRPVLAPDLAHRGLFAASERLTTAH